MINGLGGRITPVQRGIDITANVVPKQKTLRWWSMLRLGLVGMNLVSVVEIKSYNILNVACVIDVFSPVSSSSHSLDNLTCHSQSHKFANYGRIRSEQKAEFLLSDTILEIPRTDKHPVCKYVILYILK